MAESEQYGGIFADESQEYGGIFNDNTAQPEPVQEVQPEPVEEGKGVLGTVAEVPVNIC